MFLQPLSDSHHSSTFLGVYCYTKMRSKTEGRLRELAALAREVGRNVESRNRHSVVNLISVLRVYDHARVGRIEIQVRSNLDCDEFFALYLVLVQKILF